MSLTPDEERLVDAIFALPDDERAASLAACDVTSPNSSEALRYCIEEVRMIRELPHDRRAMVLDEIDAALEAAQILAEGGALDDEWLPQVNRLEIAIPALPRWDELVRIARAHAPRDVSDDLRAVRNYVRHELTPYEKWIHKIPGYAIKAHERLCERIDSAVDKAIISDARPPFRISPAPRLPFWMRPWPS